MSLSLSKVQQAFAASGSMVNSHVGYAVARLENGFRRGPRHVEDSWRQFCSSVNDVADFTSRKWDEKPKSFQDGGRKGAAFLASSCETVEGHARNVPRYIQESPENVIRFVKENPVKVYSGLFLGGSGLMALNGIVYDSPLWVAGGVLAATADANKLVHGTGAKKIDVTEDIEVQAIVKGAPRAIVNASVDLVKDVAHVVDPSWLWGRKGNFWVKEVAPVVGQQLSSAEGRQVVVDQMGQAVNAPHKYPLNAGWLPYIGAGGLYTAFAVSGGLDGVVPEALIIGLPCIAAPVVGALSAGQGMPQVGKIYCVATLSELVGGSGVIDAVHTMGEALVLDHAGLVEAVQGGARSMSDAFNEVMVASGLLYWGASKTVMLVKVEDQSKHSTEENARKATEAAVPVEPAVEF